MLIGPADITNVTMMVAMDKRPQWTEKSRRAYLVFWTLHTHFIGAKEIHDIYMSSFVKDMSYGSEEGARVIQEGLNDLHDKGYVLIADDGWMHPTSLFISMYNGD